MNKSRHVTPSPRGGWIVRQYGSARASRAFGSQDEAVRFAREKTRREGGELFIHRRDGTISEHLTYGRDPHPATG